MKLHHFRNATLVIEAGSSVILVDPMLGPVGSGLPFTLFRYKAKRNPLVPLPASSKAILTTVTHCLITHLHPDHLDNEAETFLKSANIPVICSVKDEKALKSKGLNVTQVLNYWTPVPFLGGTITGIPAVHGYGFVAGLMGNVMGFHLELPGEPSLYLSADTIYTDDVEKVLTQLKPDMAVVACGTARLDIGQPLLMVMDDILTFVERSPGKVLANHLEALNHCPTTRHELKTALAAKGLLSKVTIPEDGDTIVV
jgi:L-ascorbate metabolism protein UlaG (beta-lactamase superfamily)